VSRSVIVLTAMLKCKNGSIVKCGTINVRVRDLSLFHFIFVVVYTSLVATVLKPWPEKTRFFKEIF